MSASSLSIVIPAYNESARIGKTLREVVAYLEEQPGGGEVIVVDDGSKDDTRGVSESVFGSRALDRKLIGTHQPWMREQSGRVFNLVMRLLTGLPFKDTQCGFKAFRMDVCRPVVEGALIDRFGFDVELLHVAHRAGLRMFERAVRWDDVEGGSVSFRSGLQGFDELRLIRRNARRGLYDRAVERAREAAERVKGRRPLAEESEVESDVSPELAG